MQALELDGTEFFDPEISVEMSASGAAGTKETAEPLFVYVKGLPEDIKMRKYVYFCYYLCIQSLFR